ncbi:glycogen/starch synthase [Patescibacteria group bacterium]|nr:glycogen/starch synthase [Patescibacteria group bacterium]
MHVLFVTSEVANLYKLGGLGDVSYALPIALTRLGVHVDIAIPYYTKIKQTVRTRCMGSLAVDYDGKRELVFLFRRPLGKSAANVILFRHPRLNDYHGKPIQDVFVFFSRAVAAYYAGGKATAGYTYDIVHCQDWHTALVPLLIGEENKLGRRSKISLQSRATRTILTIHNLLYQGVTGAETTDRAGIPRGLLHVYPGKQGPSVNILREGLEYADVISTVSPTYAREILTSDYGEHVNGVLARRRDRVAGILNGISFDRWNPGSDEYLWRQYDRESVFAAKAANKEHIQTVFQLPRVDIMLFGYVSRLEVRQKGIELVEEMVESSFLEKLPGQLVILGTGPKAQVDILENLAGRHRGHVAFFHTFDERLARRIYAGADALLVPSKFEPCGLTQMIAMRYGTVPVVRETGGLADTVEQGKTGFVFHEYRAEALAQAMRGAHALQNGKPAGWRRMVLRIMAIDNSWVKSARGYLRLYRKLLRA